MSYHEILLTSTILVLGCEKFQSNFNYYSLKNYNKQILYANLDSINITFDEDQSYIFIVDVGDVTADVKEKIDILVRIPIRSAIVASSQSGTTQIAVAAMKAGAVEYLHWPFSKLDLEEAIFYADALLAEKARVPAAKTVRARFEALSPRERIVAEGIVAGKQNKMIASDLGLSVRTIEMYRASLMRKIGARSVNDILRLNFLQY